MKTIRPLGNQVLIGPLPKRLVTPGGIYLIERYVDDEKSCVVTAVGPKVKDIPIGSHVIVEELGYNRKPVEDGTGRIIVDAREIVAVVEKVP